MSPPRNTTKYTGDYSLADAGGIEGWVFLQGGPTNWHILFYTP